MKIAVIGETRLPVLPYGPGGLGRATHDIATALKKRNQDVTLFARWGSDFDGGFLPPEAFYFGQFDVTLDYSHEHRLSQQYPDAPVLNLIGDRECPYPPPNAIVESMFMQDHYKGSKLVSAGLNIDEIPFCDGGDYLIYVGMNVWHKQPEVAREVAKQAGKDLIMIGPDLREVDEDEKWQLLGGALGVLCPYLIDASPRVPIEAAACGTPTICLDGDGTKDHVVGGMTGFICKDQDEMIEAVDALHLLNREKCRIWAKQNHDIGQTIIELEGLLTSVFKGERW